jgi:hypothetical protein
LAAVKLAAVAGEKDGGHFTGRFAVITRESVGEVIGERGSNLGVLGGQHFLQTDHIGATFTQESQNLFAAALRPAVAGFHILRIIVANIVSEDDQGQCFGVRVSLSYSTQQEQPV